MVSTFKRLAPDGAQRRLRSGTIRQLADQPVRVHLVRASCPMYTVFVVRRLLLTSSLLATREIESRAFGEGGILPMGVAVA